MTYSCCWAITWAWWVTLSRLTARRESNWEGFRGWVRGITHPAEGCGVVCRDKLTKDITLYSGQPSVHVPNNVAFVQHMACFMGMPGIPSWCHGIRGTYGSAVYACLLASMTRSWSGCGGSLQQRRTISMYLDRWLYEPLGNPIYSESVLAHW